MIHRCQICNKTIKTANDPHQKRSEHFPFCSKRCKLIDLGAWLDTKYKVISESAPCQPEDL